MGLVDPLPVPLFPYWLMAFCCLLAYLCQCCIHLWWKLLAPDKLTAVTSDSVLQLPPKIHCMNVLHPGVLLKHMAWLFLYLRFSNTPCPHNHLTNIPLMSQCVHVRAYIWYIFFLYSPYFPHHSHFISILFFELELAPNFKWIAL